MTLPAPTPTFTRRRALAIWTLCCALAGAVFAVYALASLAAGRGEYVMPLDDVYIHFQYARQLAAGQPYIYNPGLPPTSGATSFLYPYLLAVGDLLGFRDLNLGVWAMGIGFVALALSTWLVYRLGRLRAPEWAALGVAVLFALNGAVAWHFMSGMETGLVILFSLLALYAFMTRRFALSVAGAVLLALIRPETGAFAVLIALGWGWRILRAGGSQTDDTRTAPARLSLLWLALPVLAVGAQPLVNLALTGSMVASGNASKSIFGIVPFYPDYVLRRVVENFARMWLEFFTGVSPREGVYIPFIVSIFALVGLARLLRRRQTRLTGVLLVVWLVVGTAAVATLDTSFWHFKRYQMPLLALFFPLAAWGCGGILARAQHAAPLRRRVVLYAALALAALPTLWTIPQFVVNFALNADYVYLQPLQMARWLRYNTPPDSLVAIHDTGLLRYIGQRTSIDIVGLTTPGAAESWRNGPGAVAELLDRERPDYIANYGRGHGFGLGYLADTSLYARVLAFYPLVLDNWRNVALAADTQGIYQPDWTPADRGTAALQPSIRRYIGDSPPLYALDVADLAAEKAVNYRWNDAERLGGFPTDVYELDYLSCALDSCRVMDGGRRINGEESFDIPALDGDVILVTRLHPVNAGAFDVYVNDTLIDTRIIPALPGSWLEAATLIPAEYVRQPARIRIVPRTPGGHYVPYHHWLYAADYDQTLPDAEPYATFQNGAIMLYDPRLVLVTENAATLLQVTVTWGTDGSAQGDYKIFIHVLDAAGEMVGQADVRPGGNALPPGNWLAGAFSDTIMVDLSQVPPGRYQVVMGLYDPVTFERLTPSGGDEAQRLPIGEVELNRDG